MNGPQAESWGLRKFAVVDLNGNLLRCISPFAGQAG
jgi:hypothetical protein